MQKAKVLLVDDRAENLLAMEAILRDSSYVLVQMTSGIDAVEYLKTQEVALIILDAQMPNQDGFETAIRIKLLPTSAQTPILFLTALNRDPGYIERAFASGAVDFMTKPIDDLIFRLKVKAFVDLYRERKYAAHMADSKVADAKHETFETLRALQESEARFRTITDAMPQMVWSTQPDGYHDFYNKRWYEFTGVPDGTTDGEGWNDLFHPEDQAVAWQKWRHSLATGEPYEIEYRLKHHSGHYRWTLGRALPVKNEKGEIVRWMGTCTEIQDQKDAEATLKRTGAELEALVRERTAELTRQQTFLNAVLENTEAGIVACDAEGKLTLFNRATRDFHGLPAEGIFPTEWSDHYSLFRGDARTPLPTDEIPLFRALRGEVVENAEMVIAPRNGKTRFLRASGRAIFDGEGNKIGAVVVMHDISDIKEAEDKLVHANKELEAFSYSVSHDLRTPLRSIEGFSQAVVEDEADRLSERGKKDLTRVIEAGQRMGRLIDDLLNLSRLSRKEMNTRPVDLTSLSRQVLEKIKADHPERNVEFEINEVPKVVGDEGLLEVALSNLFENAWKFTSKTEKPRIELKYESVDGRGVFSICDNGAGFDMTYSSKLFGAFQRLHRATEFAGTGIGLATVRRIINRHGGEIWAEGQVGGGATFSFTLPLWRHDALAARNSFS